MIFTLLYLLGCVASYARWTAAEYFFWEKTDLMFRFRYMKNWCLKEPLWGIILVGISWFGFALGYIFYIRNNEKYLFKWSYKGL